MTSPLLYGRVEDWIGGLVVDGLDADDLPDDVDLTGTATFEPVLTDEKGGIRVPGMIPRPKWLNVQPVTATYANGRLTHRGLPYVMLLSPASEINPTNWKWKVSFNLKLNGSSITRTSFAFVLPPYDPDAAPPNPGGLNPTVVNLVTVQPIAVPGPGTGVVQGPRGFGVVDVEAVDDGGVATLQFKVASESGPVPIGDPIELPGGGGALPDGGVTTPKLATDSVTQDKIAPAAVGNAELDTAAVTPSKLATEAVTAAKVAPKAIAKSKLSDDLAAELDGKLTKAVGDQNYAPADDANLLSWRRKIAERDDRVVRVVSLGNSWVAPVGASEPDKGWYSLVADVLGAGSSGRHISPRAPHSVNLAGNATYDDNANPHMVILATDGISTFFDLGDYDTIDVFYMRVGDPANPSVGRPRFSIDGGAYSDAYAADIDLFSPGSSYRLGRIANFTGDTLRLRPHATAGSGSYTFGIIARRGTLGRGVEWINWGVSGWTAARWMQVATNWPVAEPLKALPADLLHIELGANDALQGLSVASMINELRNLVTLYRGQAAPQCALLFTLMPYPDASIPDADWDTRMDAIAALAAEFGGFVSDWRKQLGRQSQIGALVIGPTDFHLNDTGHRYVADVVARLLAPPVAVVPGLSAAVQAALDRAGVVAPELVTLVVRPNPGPGEYASPKLANDAITDASPLKRYEVIVNPGTYTEVNWVVKPYVAIIGTDRTRCIIKGELPVSATDTQIAANSTLWLRGTATLRNLTITARNMRYPVHSEDVGNNTDAVHIVDNCWIEHFGNDAVAAYRTANSQPAGSPWGAIFAWGYGSASGVVEKFTDTTFVSLGTPFLVHNNAGFTKANVNDFDRCRFIKARPRTNGPIQSNDAILSIQGLGSGVRDKFSAGRSEIAQSFISEIDTPWIPTTAAGQYANHSDFDITISDSLIGFQTYNRGKALRINSAGASTSTVRVSGTAVPIVLGEPIYFDGADILKGYAYGTLDISGILVGPNADQTVANTLGRRLGNCTGAPKTLTMTFQSGTSVTHTFDQDYTSVSNADIINALNTTIGANGSAAEYLVSQGEVYPNFLDRQRTLRNSGTISIIRFSAVKFVAGAVQVMATNDPASLFAGVAIDPIPVGKTGRILTEGLLAGTQLRFGPAITEGSPTYLSDSTAGAFSASGTRAVGMGHSSGFLYFKGAIS